jgi:phosphatidate cytidylyltransferase
MSNFWQRTITGIAYVAVLLGMTFYHPTTLGILFLTMTIIGCNEFYTIAIKGDNLPQKIMGILIASSAFILSFLTVFYELPTKFMALLIPLMLALLPARRATRAQCRTCRL